jgi:hypothetical protein
MWLFRCVDDYFDGYAGDYFYGVDYYEGDDDDVDDYFDAYYVDDDDDYYVDEGD